MLTVRHFSSARALLRVAQPRSPQITLIVRGPGRPLKRLFASTRAISIRQVRQPKISAFIQSASAFRPSRDISRYQQRRSASQR